MPRLPTVTEHGAGSRRISWRSVSVFRGTPPKKPLCLDLSVSFRSWVWVRFTKIRACFENAVLNFNVIVQAG